MPIQKLLFVDTNILLDFYRARTDAGLKLLEHLEKISDRLIVTYQLEMEFKKNRQYAIAESLQELKPPAKVPRPGLFSDAKDVKALEKSIKAATLRVNSLKTKLRKALINPAAADPVYRACQRIFHAKSDLVLSRDDQVRRLIRRRAFRRFILGCPPRKKSDTSIGDAINWEWMVECALRKRAELVIVTRDSDYGLVFEDRAYVNDHLRQEFSDRVSQKREVLLYTRLSDALKHFHVEVTAQEAQEEELLAKSRPDVSSIDAKAIEPSLRHVARWMNDYNPAPEHNTEVVFGVLRDLLAGMKESWVNDSRTPGDEKPKGQ